MGRILKHLKYPVRYPGIIPRAAENYFRMMVLGQKRLRAVEFAVNYVCQCQCAHCSVEFLGQKRRPLLDTAQVSRVLDELHDMGVMNINFTGGEAILRPDLRELVRAARPKSTVVSVATAATMVDAKIADDLRDWGVRIVTISLDSADAETHDRSRRHPGSYDKVMNATRLFQERDIDVFWCTILTDENAINGDMLRLVDQAEEWGVTLTINFSCPVGAWHEQPVGVAPELKVLHRELMEREHVRWEGHSNYHKEGCPAGIEKLYISPYGEVMPCPFIHVTFGNVLQRSVKDIWNEMTGTEPFHEVQEGCPVAENPTFFVQYLSPLKTAEIHPVSIEQIGVTPSSIKTAPALCADGVTETASA
ncbi:MAG: radical SAM protein [Deltaproteobacteria bacterium]|nr:radical SAM protein [Deltaproteobacteria bacterium]